MLKRKNTVSLIILAAFFVMLLGSCDPSKKYEREENAKIQDYLNYNPDLNFEPQPSGLYYLEVLPGTGIMPVAHDTVYVIYTGQFLDGSVFDTNVGKDTLVFPLDEGWMIPGLEEGISKMSVGGKSVLLIPSKLAYGSSGFYIIPGYTPLLYDVELARVMPGPVSGK